MRTVSLVLSVAAILVAQPAGALYETGGPVKLLTGKNFKSAVIESDVPAVRFLFSALHLPLLSKWSAASHPHTAVHDSTREWLAGFIDVVNYHLSVLLCYSRAGGRVLCALVRTLSSGA